MEKKTIESLNSKTWYRLIKVIYVCIFIIIPLLVYGLLTYSSGLKRVDNSKTLIKCGYSEPGEGFFADEIGLSFSPNDFKKSLETNTYVLNYRNYLYYDEYDALAIVKKCYSTIDLSGDFFNDIYVLQALFEGGLDKNGQIIENLDDPLFSKLSAIHNAYSYEKSKHVNFSVEMFKVIPHFSYIPIIKEASVVLLTVLLIFEFFRRIFYYIVLGTFLPKKK